MVEDLKKGGSFLLNCQWTPEELDEKLPGKVKKYIADNDINFYTIDGYQASARRSALAPESTPFCSLHSSTSPKIIPEEDAIQLHEGCGYEVLLQEG